MKALVVTPDGVAVEEVPDPHPAPDGVVVSVHSCGICGSDVHYLARAPMGQIKGHEFSGTILEVGGEVRDFTVGQAVAVNPLGGCGTCKACRLGLTLLCTERPNLGLSAPGAFAEFVGVPSSQLVAIPDGTDIELGAHAEPLAVALGAIDMAGSPEGKTVVVYGVGPIGLKTIMALRVAGAKWIVGVGRSPGRRAAAMAVGADVVIDSRELSIADYAKANDLAFDQAYECSGANDAVLFLGPAMKIGATIVGLALPTEPGPVDFFGLVNQSLRIVGSCAFDPAQYRRSVELLATGVIDPEPLVSDRVPLGEAPGAFARLEHPGELVGILVQPWR